MPETPDFTSYHRAQGESLLRRLTVWAGLGAMVATGAVAAVVAHALPGRTTTSSPSAAASASGVGSPSSGTAARGSAAAAPTPAPAVQQPVVTSGGS